MRPAVQQEQSCLLNFNGSNIEDSSILLHPEVGNVEVSLPTGENQLSLKDTLAAVRNAAQAAARIQNAFPAHSFRKRQEKEDDVTAACVDEFGISLGENQNLSTTSKLVFGSAHEYSSAALSIQKKFRGWKCPWLNVRMHVNNIAGFLKSIAKLRLSLLTQKSKWHQLP